MVSFVTIRDENDRERSGKLSNHFRFHIFIRKRKRKRESRSEKRNRKYGMSETEQFDRKHIGNGRNR